MYIVYVLTSVCSVKYRLFLLSRVHKQKLYGYLFAHC